MADVIEDASKTAPRTSWTRTDDRGVTTVCGASFLAEPQRFAFEPKALCLKRPER